MGHGAAIVRAYVAEGAQVVIGDVAKEQGQALADELGDRASFVALDVSDAASWAAALDATHTAYGPVTVLAVGIGDSAGWGAYSCDPDRKCRPVKIGAPTKWGKRVAERVTQACEASTTLWFPPDKRACPPPTRTQVDANRNPHPG